MTAPVPPSPSVKHPVAGIDAAIGDLMQRQPRLTAPAGYQLELPAAAGQRDAATAQAQLQPPTPTPPPKRPRGKLLIGLMLTVLMVIGAHILWDGLFRYRAYGLVEAARFEVRASVSGVVQRIYVSEGDRVKTGDLLVVIDQPEFEQKLRRTRDELRYAEAELDATISRLRNEVHEHTAEMFELSGRLRGERAGLDRLARSLERATKLKEAGVMTADTFEQIDFDKQAHEGRIAMYEEAVAKLRQRCEVDSGDWSVPLEQIKPALIRIEQVRHEIERLQEEAQSYWIRAAIPGVILKRHCLTGRRINAAEPLFEMIEPGSEQAVIYLKQATASDFQPGSQVSIRIEPFSQSIPCRVQRIGHEFVPVPLAISRFYSVHEPVLPVTLKPEVTAAMPLGAMIKVPHEAPFNVHELFFRESP